MSHWSALIAWTPLVRSSWARAFVFSGLNSIDANAYYARGLAYHQRGDYDRAIRDYDEAIRLKPQYANAYYARGVIYGLLGDQDKKKQDLDRASVAQEEQADIAFRGRLRPCGGPWLARFSGELAPLRKRPRSVPVTGFSVTQAPEATRPSPPLARGLAAP